MTRPTPRGAALVAVAAGTYVAARILGTWELYVVALAFTAMVCVSWALVAAGSRRLHVSRGVTPDAPVAGDLLLFSFRVRSGSSLPWLQITLHNAVGSLGGSDRPVEVESLGGRAQRVGHLGAVAGAARRAPPAGHARRGGRPARPGERAAECR